MWLLYENSSNAHSLTNVRRLDAFSKDMSLASSAVITTLLRNNCTSKRKVMCDLERCPKESLMYLHTESSQVDLGLW